MYACVIVLMLCNVCVCVAFDVVCDVVGDYDYCYSVCAGDAVDRYVVHAYDQCAVGVLLM